MAVHCFSDMQLKLGFSIERKCYVYNISITLSPLSIYIYTVAYREGGGGDEVWEMWKDVTPPSTFQNRIRFMQNISVQSRFTQQAVVIYSCLTYQYYDSVKGYEIVNRTTSSNTLKQLQLNHLVGLNLYFLTPLFWYRPTTAYICIYNITQVKYL